MNWLSMMVIQLQLPMYQLFKKIINLIGQVPLMRYPLKVFYLWAIRKTKIIAKSIDEIEDILLISKLDHKNFIYGHSDLNLVFMINDDAHPKKILFLIREQIKNLWPANILVNTNDLSVLKKSEINTPIIRSYLVKKFFNNEVKWKSTLNKSTYSFNLKAQDHFSIQYEYITNIDNYLFNAQDKYITTHDEIRSTSKKIFSSISGLKKYNLIVNDYNKRWLKLANKLMNFSLFKTRKFNEFRLSSFKYIDGVQKVKNIKEDFPEIYDEELLKFCLELVHKDFIYDIFLSPALIQLDHESVKGRVYVDILLNTTEVNSKTYNKLIDKIQQVQKTNLDTNTKLIFNFSTFEINHLKDQYVLSDYPLRGFYRAQQGFSFNTYKYEYSKDKKLIEKAAINYLLLQFMLFRSKEHREHLMGSKFIKSLNIIYQYKLLLDNLQGKEFAISHNYKSIVDELGVQLSVLSPDDIVDEKNWPIVRSQMLYILKMIRDELAKQYPSLKNIQF